MKLITDAEFIAKMERLYPKDVKRGKLRVRLKGKALESLRTYCALRDGQRCQECDIGVFDDLPDWHDQKYHMAHIQSRGACGSDVPSNVRTLCGQCHRKEHSGKLDRRP
jgi:5-methylcytosine-specific restriction endonuclease McrA